MKKLMDVLERLTLAVTFAEANEHRTALQLLDAGSGNKQRVQEEVRPGGKRLQQKQEQPREDLSL